MSDRDASFADGAPGPARLALKADDAESLTVISALLQDAIGKTSEIAWMPRRHTFAMVVNRFRWEATREGDARFERVRTGLHFETVRRVRAHGLDTDRAQQVFELLAITYESREDAPGIVTLSCAGDATFALEVEALDLTMSDMDARWETAHRPDHGAEIADDS